MTRTSQDLLVVLLTNPEIKFIYNPLLSSLYKSSQFTFFTQCTCKCPVTVTPWHPMGYSSFIFESSWPEAPSWFHLPKPVESPCSVHQAGILVSVHCLTLLDKQALHLLVAQGKLPFTLCYPVKYFLTTTL